MTEIDFSSGRIVGDINAGKAVPESDLIDGDSNDLSRDQFRLIDEAAERRTKGDRSPLVEDTKTAQVATIKVNDWTLYSPWEGTLFGSSRK